MKAPDMSASSNHIPHRTRRRIRDAIFLVVVTAAMIVTMMVFMNRVLEKFQAAPVAGAPQAH